MIASEPGPPESMRDTWSSAAPAAADLGQVSPKGLLVRVENIWELEMSELDCPLSSVLQVNLCAHLVLGLLMEMVF